MIIIERDLREAIDAWEPLMLRLSTPEYVIERFDGATLFAAESHRSAFRMWIARRQRGTAFFAAKAELPSAIFGMALVVDPETPGPRFGVFVTPHRRRQGVGTALYRAAAAAFAPKSLTVSDHTEDVRAFFRRVR